MMMRWKRGVLLIILMTTAVAPILLYTDHHHRLSTSFDDTPPKSATKELVVEDADASHYSTSNINSSQNGQDSARSDSDRRSRVIKVASQSRVPLQIESLDDGKKDGIDDHLNVHIRELAQEDMPQLLINDTASTAQENITQEQQSTTQHTSSNKVDTQVTVKSKSKQKVLPDARVKQLKDLLIRGKVYLSLAATRSSPHYIKELRLRLKEAQRALGDASKDSDLPRNAKDKMKALDQTLARGQHNLDDCSAAVKKLRAMLHSTEEQLQAHTKQAMFLTQLTAKTLPKGLHCLPLRLSIDYQLLNDSQRQFPNQHNLENSGLYHYALFSDNILATAVVVNSTVSHAKDPSKHVFHIVTDRLNYEAMRMWFLSNPAESATIQVKKVEDFTWFNPSYSPILRQLSSPSLIEYYFKDDQANTDMNLKFRNPKYLSILNHLRFYLPEIFPRLNKVLFLDDDIVVQKDLTALWSIDLKGNVNGAVETCNEGFHRLDSYLNFSNPVIAKNFDPSACGWAYGMNMFDLNEWKKHNITNLYHSWQKLNIDRELWKLGTLPPGLITFYKHTFPLNRTWHVLGLGYNPNVSERDIDQAAVVHFNGNMKPWLEVGIPKFRKYWSKFIDYDNTYLQECKINP